MEKLINFKDTEIMMSDFILIILLSRYLEWIKQFM